jgi:GntR family transcriptional regulator
MPTQQTAGVVPVHHQIADALRARIKSGELQPDDQVPTIAQLATEWSCTPVTVKAALSVLRNEGLITAGRGRPATVRRPPQRTPIKLDPTVAQEMKTNVLRPLSERKDIGAIELTAGLSIDDVIPTHHYDIITATPELAKEFSIPTDSKLQQRTYQMTHPSSGHRLTWSVSYIPLHLIESNPRLLDDSEEPWPGGHLHQLYTVGIEIDRFERSIIATAPTPRDRQLWGMDEGVPLLRIRSKSIDIHSRVVELSDAEYPADRTEIAFTEQLNRWPEDYPPYSKDEDK